MTDIPDWEKKYWERRIAQNQGNNYNKTRDPNDLPHFEPAHITQNKNRQRDISNNDGWQDVDPMRALQGRMGNNPGNNNNNNNNPGSPCVMLREGAVFYRAVQADGFGTTMPMVRNCGPVVGVTGREFEFRGERSCYLIDNMEVVDLSNINPQKMLKLVEVTAPFLGTLLVEKSSVITIQQPNSRPQLLND